MDMFSVLVNPCLSVPALFHDGVPEAFPAPMTLQLRLFTFNGIVTIRYKVQPVMWLAERRSAITCVFVIMHFGVSDTSPLDPVVRRSRRSVCCS